jgi:DNA-binding transcriptional ArsR family regulator
VRRKPAEIAADAEDAFVAALSEALQHSLEIAAGPPDGPDLLIALPGGGTLATEIKAIATRAEPGPITDSLRTWDAELAAMRSHTATPVVGVVVAGAIPDATKAILREHDWGWLDRRGELDLRGPGLVVHTTDLTPTSGPTSSNARAPIQGRAGIATAACLLMAEDRVPGVREIARRADLAPSTVSTTLAALRRASLVEDDGHPLVPELFWSLADAWTPERHAFADVPTPGTRLDLGLQSLDEPGWAVGSTLAAAAWGAPVVVASDAPPDFYVPEARDLRRAQRELPAASSAAERRCTIAVAPTALVVRPRFDAVSLSTSWLHWPVVHPLFVALDLALDRARGTEILQDWNVPRPFRKVW